MGFGFQILDFGLDRVTVGGSGIEETDHWIANALRGLLWSVPFITTSVSVLSGPLVVQRQRCQQFPST